MLVLSGICCCFQEKDHKECYVQETICFWEQKCCCCSETASEAFSKKKCSIFNDRNSVVCKAKMNEFQKSNKWFCTNLWYVIVAEIQELKVSESCEWFICDARYFVVAQVQRQYLMQWCGYSDRKQWYIFGAVILSSEAAVHFNCQQGQQDCLSAKGTGMFLNVHLCHPSHIHWCTNISV